MSFTLVLNASNVIGSSNSQFQYNFIGGGLKLKNAKMCVSQVTIPYSFQNLNAQYYQNTNSRYTWVDGTVYNDVIPNGYYTVPDLNSYLQQLFISRNQYLITPTGSYQYYIALSYNATFYSCQITTLPVPLVVPAGWTAPVGFVFSTPSAICPLYSIVAQGLGTILGFPVGSYPATLTVTTGQTFISSTYGLVPLGSNVNSLVIKSNLVNNPVTMPSDIIDAMPINTTFGSNINYLPTFEKWVNLSSGTFSNMIITFTDENFNTLPALDPHVSITLLIRTD